MARSVTSLYLFILMRIFDQVICEFFLVHRSRRMTEVGLAAQNPPSIVVLLGFSSNGGNGGRKCLLFLCKRFYIPALPCHIVFSILLFHPPFLRNIRNLQENHR